MGVIDGLPHKTAVSARRRNGPACLTQMPRRKYRDDCYRRYLLLLQICSLRFLNACLHSFELSLRTAPPDVWQVTRIEYHEEKKSLPSSQNFLEEVISAACFFHQSRARAPVSIRNSITHTSFSASERARRPSPYAHVSISKASYI